MDERKPLDLGAAVGEVWEFGYSNIMQLRELFRGDASKSKAVLARHLGQLVLQPKKTPAGPVYEVAGDLASRRCSVSGCHAPNNYDETAADAIRVGEGQTSLNLVFTRSSIIFLRAAGSRAGNIRRGSCALKVLPRWHSTVFPLLPGAAWQPGSPLPA
jgi:hypothetical protein